MLLYSKGLRLAELPAIKLEDVDFEHKQVYIHRMETRIKVNGKSVLTVVPYNKQRSPSAIRWLDLTDQELAIIKKILEVNKTYGFEDDGFLFVDENGRTKARAIDERIRKMCRKIGMKEKSAHDIRRTCASNLYHSGMSIEYLKDYLGHSDTKTTRGYIYDVNTKEKNRRLLNNSISQSFNLPV